MKKQEFWSIENVSSFCGHDVVNGEVDLSDDAWEEKLDELYGEVEVCGYSYGAGCALRKLDPVAFRCGKNDEESSIQAELETQLDREDPTGIEFIDGEEEDSEDMTDYDKGYDAYEKGSPRDDGQSDDWVAGWADAKANDDYSKENPI